MTTMPRWGTPKEYAAIYRIHEKTVLKMCRAGKLEASTYGVGTQRHRWRIKLSGEEVDMLNGLAAERSGS